MASGEAAGGTKKRKASAATEDIITLSPVARREPRRGMGVAELERIRVTLEMAERCYAAASSSLSAHQHHPALAHHQHVVNGAVHHHLQMTRRHLTPYCLAQHCYANDSLTRLFTTNGSSHHQNLHSSHHQKLHRQANQIQSAVTALPVMGQAASSESSSSASQRQGPRRRRAHAKPGQTTAAALPQVAFVDLVDSDDDTAGTDVEELDLELKL